ncbi:MAG: D-alanine-D-alanine ligase [Candidatus Marinimicrobia bacterium]|jgi:D-alanine-D-alanine ligase|nr:D-alanine-D-alanine ligase [Candidatus Neomarinimicrobiota bacterium]
MNIGFTYDLKDDYLRLGYSDFEVAEFDSIETVEGVESVLKSMGHTVDRIGSARELMQRLCRGDRWDLVFNIAEGVRGIGREAQVPAILDVYNIPYVFSDPLVFSVTLHKGMAKRIVRDGGVKTPDFQIIRCEADVWQVNLPYPLFVKPLAEGTGKGIGAKSVVESKEELFTVSKNLLDRYRQPVLVERFLPGREFTVGITGSGTRGQVVGVMEICFLPDAASEIYGLVNKKNYQDFVRYRVPERRVYEACSELALKAWSLLECRDGGRIDIRHNENGEPEFIEVNPLAGLHPVESDFPILARLNGVSYEDLIGRIMESASLRIFGDISRE